MLHEILSFAFPIAKSFEIGPHLPQSYKNKVSFSHLWLLAVYNYLIPDARYLAKSLQK